MNAIFYNTNTELVHDYVRIIRHSDVSEGRAGHSPAFDESGTADESGRASISTGTRRNMDSDNHSHIHGGAAPARSNALISYGGSQLWFDGDMHRCGCGVIAAADVLLYLRWRDRTGRLQSDTRLKSAAVQQTPGDDLKVSCYTDHAKVFNNLQIRSSVRSGESHCHTGFRISYDSYAAYIRRIRYAFPLIPHRGMPGALLAMYLNIYFRVRRMRYRAHWHGTIGSAVRTCTELIHSALPFVQSSVPDNTDSCISSAAASTVSNLTDKRGSFSKVSISDKLRSAIAADTPVILCIGPGMHQLLPAANVPHRGLLLYSKSGITDSADCADSTGITGCAYTPAKYIRSHFVVITGISDGFARVSSWGQEYYIELAELETYSGRDMFGLFTNIITISAR